MKRCTGCGEEKPLEEFYRKRGRSGPSPTMRHPRCKPCYAQDAAARRERNRHSPLPLVEKRCTICRTVKPASEFTRNEASPDCLHSFCKPCRRSRERDRRYGLGPGQYDTMLVQQGGGCGICRTPLNLVVDHCHDSGIVRGLLCDHCNHGIGKLKDDPELMLRAAEYVLEHRNVLPVL